MARILVIDSYDSFVYNIVQYLGELGAEPVVVRNDQLTVNEAVALAPDGVLLSPGPGRPRVCSRSPIGNPCAALINASVIHRKGGEGDFSRSLLFALRCFY